MVVAAVTPEGVAKLPKDEAPPETVNLEPGSVVPIPTLPVEIAVPVAVLTSVAKIRLPMFRKLEVVVAGVPA